MPQLSPGSARKTLKGDITLVQPQSVTLAVPKGTPLQVALEQELCVKKVGQAVRGRLMQPIYAFDQIVIPMGSVINGKITKIESVSRGKRTLAALDADFTPTRKVEISFDELLLADEQADADRNQRNSGLRTGDSVCGRQGKEKDDE